jgi:ABC-type transport system involved in cytochrome c biogenesis permease component
MVLCFALAHRRNIHLQIVAGQTVFAWMGVVLLAVTLSRLATFLFNMPADAARQITGAVYVLCVIGIIWSVARHARRTTD